MKDSEWSPLHATALWWEGVSFLLLGPPGSGKSDLALRVIFEAQGKLIADDQCEFSWAPTGVLVRGLPLGQGLLEVRGLGIATLSQDQWTPGGTLGFAVRLTPASQIPREPVEAFLEGTTVPLYPLDPLAPGALARLKLLVRTTLGRVSLSWPQDVLQEPPKRATRPL